MAFYGNTVKRDIFFHIVRFLHFSDNRNEPGKIDENYDRLWKIRTIFDKLSDAHAKYYGPTEHLAIDPDLFDNLHMKAIKCCDTVRPNRKGMPSDFGRKLRLKRGYIKTGVKGNLTAVVWKDK
jgi:hypothetical protein